MAIGVSNAELEELNLTDLALVRNGDSIFHQATIEFRQLGEPSLLAERLVVQLVGEVMQRRLLSAERTEIELGELLQRANPRPVFLWAYHQASGVRQTHRLEYERADASLRTALTLGQGLDDPLCAEHSMLMLGRSGHRQGQPVQALQLMADLIQPAHARSTLIPSAHSYVAEIFEQHHHLEAALAHRKASIDREFALSPRQQAEFHAGLAHVHISLGQPGAAAEVLAVAASRVTVLAWSFTEALVDVAIARLDFVQGNLPVAQARLARTVETFTKTGNRFDELQARLVQAKINAEIGELSYAQTLVEDPLARRMPRWYQVELSLLRSHLAQIDGVWKQVVANQHEAERLEEEGESELTELYPLLREYQEGLSIRKTLRKTESAHRRLSQAQLDKADLLNAIAHDLQSPLMALDLTLKFLEIDADGTASIARIESADETIRRVQGLVQQLDILDGTSGSPTPPRIGAITLGPMLERVVREFASSAQGKNILLEQHCQPRATVLGAEKELEQILGNLVSNAIKFSPSGTRVLVSVDLDLEAASNDQLIEICVSDQGQGLSKDDFQALFSKYARLSSKPTNSEPSTGMGLYIARSSARLMGGDIVANSLGKGLGATFVVSLPSAETSKRSGDANANLAERQHGRPHG